MNRRILIVDDDAAYADAVRAVLEADGYEVAVAADGDEGIRRARESVPDLIILDVMMNRLTEGLDVCRALAKTDVLKAVPVLLVTGIRDALHLPAGLTPDGNWMPVRAVLEKPIKPETLLAEIRAVLG